MYTKKVMNGKESLKLTVEISQSEPGLYTVYINGEEAAFPMMGGDEVDALSIGNILCALYDAAYGVESPRFDTSETRTAAVYHEKNPAELMGGGADVLADE